MEDGQPVVGDSIADKYRRWQTHLSLPPDVHWDMPTEAEQRVMRVLSDFEFEVDGLSAERSHWACTTEEEFKRAETLIELAVALREFSLTWEKK